MELLQARCAEQERQITSLETEIAQLREQVAFERRRARSTTEVAATPAATAPAAAKPTAKSASPEQYTVAAGDTVSAISRRYAVSAQDLMASNGIEDPTRLRVGQKLTIPGPADKAEAPAPVAAAPAPAPEEKPVAKASGQYSVKSGDTLSRVARLHGMNYSEIVALNPDIVPDRLLVGQKVNVTGEAKAEPAAVAADKVPVKTHEVASNTPAPAPKPEAKPAQPAPSPAPAREKSIASITVADEISFGAFAARHNTTPERLNALNGLRLKSSTVLAKGSELYVATNN
jgi:LysM repeat protein